MYPAPLLRRWREQAERSAARDRDHSHPAVDISEPIRYLHALGWDGLRLVVRGARGALGREFGYHVVDAPAIRTARSLARDLWPRDELDCRCLDLHELEGLGAPCANLVIPAKVGERLHRMKVPERLYREKRQEWISLEEYPCDGSDELWQLLASVRVASDSEAKGEESIHFLYEWMRRNLPRRETGGDASELQVPIDYVRRPSLVCLVLTGVWPRGTRLWLQQAGSPIFGPVTLDTRDPVVPLGVLFDDLRVGSGELYYGFVEDDADGSDENSHEYGDVFFTLIGPEMGDVALDRLADYFVGGCLRPDAARFVRPDGGVEELDLRPLRATREYIDAEIGGLSCPEVFLKVGEHAWYHVGAVLVSAEGPAARRREEHRLRDAVPGTSVTLALREVHGERAVVSASLVLRTPTGAQILAVTGQRQITWRDVVTICATPHEPGVLELHVDGYFERVPGARPSMTSR